jgi:hypothetical protein
VYGCGCQYGFCFLTILTHLLENFNFLLQRK